jgi:hypothetical protein
MKRLLIIALIAVLAVTGGVFAYTFTTATATIGVVAPTSDFAEVTANSSITAPTVFGKFAGTWPQSTLFTVTPDASYTGDLVVKVYMVNTGELIRQYDHLNMSIEYTDTTGALADTQGEAQVLNLQNGEVLFDWTSGNGTSPFNQIWMEITQR